MIHSVSLYTGLTNLYHVYIDPLQITRTSVYVCVLVPSWLTVMYSSACMGNAASLALRPREHSSHGNKPECVDHGGIMVIVLSHQGSG